MLLCAGFMPFYAGFMLFHAVLCAIVCSVTLFCAVFMLLKTGDLIGVDFVPVECQDIGDLVVK